MFMDGSSNVLRGQAFKDVKNRLNCGWHCPSDHNLLYTMIHSMVSLFKAEQVFEYVHWVCQVYISCPMAACSAYAVTTLLLTLIL